MVKKNVLTPVLAGVLGLSIVGSGVGYYVLNKDGGKGADKGKSSTTASPKISVMAENISNTLSRAQDIATGETDFAYEGTFNISFGTAVTKEMDNAPKDIGMKISSKQKGGNEGGDITLTYGGEDLMTINEVLSRENSDEAFVRIPELSDAYIKVSKEDAQKYIQEQAGVDMSELTQAAEQADIDFDAEAFETDINEYEQLIKDNFPEAKENGTKSGDIDGISYEYTSKSYEVTSADAQKIATAVLEKAKTDENIKKLYEQGVEQALTQVQTVQGGSETTAPSYEENIDKLLEQVKGEIEEESKVALETYENENGDFMGFTLTPDGEEGELKYVVVSSDDAEGIDMTFDSGDGTSMTAYGAFKSVDDTVNGKYTISVKEDDAEKMAIVYDVKDVKTVGDNFSGTIRVDVKSDEDGEAMSGWCEIASASDEDNVDVTFDLGYNGEKALTMNVTCKKTEASDVELPGSDAKIYNALNEEEMNKYLEECDLEGFQNKMKEKLGDDMYNQLFSGASSAGSLSSYETDDDDYEYSFDDDDFDWEQFETELNESESDERA